MKKMANVGIGDKVNISKLIFDTENPRQKT